MTNNKLKIAFVTTIELELLYDYLYAEDSAKLSKIHSLAGTQPANIVIQFLKMGYDISIITLSVDVKPNQFNIYHGKNLTIYVGHFRRGKKVVLDFQYHDIQLIKKMILQDKPDVITSHWTYEFALASIFSKIPTLITVRDWSPLVLKLTRKPYRFMRMLQSFLVFILHDKFIVNSEYIKGKLFFLRHRVIDLIPNGIDDDLFKKEQKQFSERDKLKIISINNGFDNIKNVKSLIVSFDNILKVYPSIEMYLIGAEHGDNDIAYKWCHENNLTKNIHFIGKIAYKAVLSYMDKCDLMVHPSREESFGNIIVEAMARKLPVIAGIKSGAVPWVVKDSGILIDINNIDEIYSAIEKFILDYNMLNIYSKKGYDNSYKRFRLSEIANKYLIHLQELI